MTEFLTGVDELLRNFDRLAKNVPEQAAGALGDRAKAILEASNRLVPVDTGELQDSGSGTEVTRRGDVIEVAVQYTAPHGAAVHEDLDVAHPSGQAKFLQQPLLQTTLRDFSKGIDLKKALR